MSIIYCKECLREKRENPYASGIPIRNVPEDGRAERNGLCCKHDRLIHGAAMPEHYGEKQVRKVQNRIKMDRLNFLLREGIKLNIDEWLRSH